MEMNDGNVLSNTNQIKNEDLNELLYFLSKVDGVISIIGTQGSGKTTLVDSIIEDNYDCSFKVMGGHSIEEYSEKHPNGEFNEIGNIDDEVAEYEKDGYLSGEFTCDKLIVDELSKDKDYYNVLVVSENGGNVIATSHHRSGLDLFESYAKICISLGKYNSMVKVFEDMNAFRFVIIMCDIDGVKYIDSINEVTYEDNSLSERPIISINHATKEYVVTNKITTDGYEDIYNSLMYCDKVKLSKWYSKFLEKYFSDEPTNGFNLTMNSREY